MHHFWSHIIDQRNARLGRQMKEDEAAHAALAVRAGGGELPAPVRGLMKAASRVMTTVAHYI